MDTDEKKDVDVESDAEGIPMTEASEQQIKSKIISETTTDGETIFRCSECNFLSPNHSDTYQHMFSHFKMAVRDENPRLSHEDRISTPSAGKPKMNSLLKPRPVDAIAQLRSQLQQSAPRPESQKNLAEIMQAKNHVLAASPAELPSPPKSIEATTATATTKPWRTVKDILLTQQNQVFKMCMECSFVANSPGELKKHSAETHAAEKPYECEVCSYRSKWKCDVKKHMKTYTHIGFILETRQGNQRKLPGLSSEDVEKTESQTTTNSNAVAPSDATFMASESNEVSEPKVESVFSSASSFFSSMDKSQIAKDPKKLDVKTKGQKCKKCGHESSDLTSYVLHKKHCNAERTVLPVQKKPEQLFQQVMKQFPCGQCPFVTNESNLLYVHLQSHAPRDGCYKCIYCTFNSPSEAAVYEHQALHEADAPEKKAEAVEEYAPIATKQARKSLSCSKCRYSTPNGNSFQKHVANHGYEGRYKCHYCCFGVDRLNHLIQHTNASHSEMLGQLDKTEFITRHMKEGGLDPSEAESIMELFKDKSWEAFKNESNSSSPVREEDTKAVAVDSQISPDGSSVVGKFRMYPQVKNPVKLEEERLVETKFSPRMETAAKQSIMNKSSDPSSLSPSTISSEAKRFSCPECPRCFSDQQSFVSHIQLHGLKLNYQCKFCPTSHGWLNLMYDHVTQAHGDSIAADEAYRGLEMEFVADRSNDRSPNEKKTVVGGPSMTMNNAALSEGGFKEAKSLLRMKLMEGHNSQWAMSEGSWSALGKKQPIYKCESCSFSTV